MIPNDFNIRQLENVLEAYKAGHIANIVVVANNENGGRYFNLCHTSSIEDQDHILRNFGYKPLRKRENPELLEGAACE